MRDKPQTPIPNWIGFAIALAWVLVIAAVIADYLLG